MAQFDYKDANGENEYSVEGNIAINVEKGTLWFGVYSGDMDGTSYTAYIPNHRAAVLQLISDLTAALEATKDLPEGFDGFSMDHCSATATPDEDEWSEAGVVSSY